MDIETNSNSSYDEESRIAGHSPLILPDLVNVETRLNSSHDEGSYIAGLRLHALRKQRKQIPKGLVCCDYDAAEKAIEAGLQGPKKFGGAHICMYCLGLSNI